uniref:Receptor L-domain domain-containing protein n=1 Tax=Chromera velia CCMP2878 TaxID=1169474 RepID=A0A0G4HMU4_9ALVE|eukprot:Cvel_29419.t1-p1 / transcript=Cvel_29419.t1 / gene=Cvel_29419 / organism=Chromera_velia_CCMP2878 / gene_product=hypothetical protein / transcript_product=hypothetical protein / location=Cvel_scaffold4016:8963-9943(-) / protein_length=327 / sequence_SO=supercontig / SO=protein_coding / is_pseudo=false
MMLHYRFLSLLSALSALLMARETTGVELKDLHLTSLFGAKDGEAFSLFNFGKDLFGGDSKKDFKSGDQKKKKEEDACFDGDLSSLPVYVPSDLNALCEDSSEGLIALEEYRSFKANNPGLHTIDDASFDWVLSTDEDESPCTSDEFSDIAFLSSTNGISTWTLNADGYTFDNVVEVEEQELSFSRRPPRSLGPFEGDTVFPCLKTLFSLRTAGQDSITEVLGFNRVENLRRLSITFKSELVKMDGFNALKSLESGLAITGSPKLGMISGFESFGPMNDFGFSSGVSVFENQEGLTVAPKLEAAGLRWAAANTPSCYRSGDLAAGNCD